MKTLITFVLCGILTVTLFAQEIPIPKKEKLLADFGNQIVTYSKKHKSVNIHFKAKEGVYNVRNIDFSNRKNFSKTIKRFNNPVIGGINTPESALEKFKIYKQGNYLYVTYESKRSSRHYTDVSVFDCATGEIKREELYSVPENMDGVSYKVKGTSCILDRMLFQTFYTGFHYGIAVYDLKSFERKTTYSSQLPKPIEFKNSGIVFIRDVKGFNLFWKDVKKRISYTSFYGKLDIDLPFICAAKNDNYYYLTLGCYDLKEYEDWNRPAFYHDSDYFFGWKFKFESDSKKSVIFYSILDGTTLEHIPND